MAAWIKPLDVADLAKSPLAPVGTWKRYVNGGAGSRGMVFGLGSFAPGEELTHEHVEEEVFFVLEGEGEAAWTEDGVTHTAPLRKGVAFFKTTFVPHTIRCTGPGNLVGIYCKV
jgi:mannose-6-phosphate isomerase-like protein (cupin superfamily)